MQVNCDFQYDVMFYVKYDVICEVAYESDVK